ncbi:putative glycolipid-binding domain-containing protein [Sphingobacterium endophyticum]|uniref:putative glycolipid-binding domain-containing protein n=1 Tax=Sphingobacterium endophyticum TaxID=2546448 RepID=UPI0012E27155|nr:putative glycolipid-binding domain-containing protein [Sphingobacterium endophyticum]
MINIIWKGVYYNSLEYLKYYADSKQNIIQSKIIGCLDAQFWYVDYIVQTNENWQINSFELSIDLNGEISTLTGKVEQGVWSINNVERKEFKNYKFIDISLSPFTNTLPINHLKMGISDSYEIQVIYINILEGKVEPRKQKYSRKRNRIYSYQNIPNTFSADIKVDKFGFVINYPKLFKRII